MDKTILDLDLVGYSGIAAILEENSGSGAVAELNAQIQGFVERGLGAVEARREHALLKTTGDGAILHFDRAELAHMFAAAVHEETRVRNVGKTEPSARRLFRMGAATGDVTEWMPAGGALDLAGLTITRAVRLEAVARPGELLVDAPTFASLPPSLGALYGGEEKVRGKRTEEYVARRCLLNPEVPGPSGEPRPRARPRGLSVALHRACAAVLMDCWEFRDRGTLEPLFGIDPLHRYARSLPLEARSRAHLVEQIIHTLVTYPAEGGLPLLELLVILREKREEGDAEREDLDRLIKQVSTYLSS
ncbi:MAG TPA: hypothetical protein VGB98_08545 [Pyrinomonadaceae bacterium]|jgi:class 3 adenylate cyclase